MAGTYQDFLDALGQRESGGDYRAVNQFNFLGKYQIGEGALIDTGYYTQTAPARTTGKTAISPEKAASTPKPSSSPAPRRKRPPFAPRDKQWQYIASVQKYDGRFSAA